MMMDSLQKLLDQFPDFLDKSDTSNFTLSQSVTNEELKKIRQSIFNTVESFHMNKRLLIWKEQNIDYEYSINFRAYYPNIKSVTLLKNDELIYSEQYKYGKVDSFEYVYNGTTSDDENPEIIPQDKFKIIVTTYDELEMVKGFPENDIVVNDEFDHDVSLDEFGALHNIPRKTYLTNLPITSYEYTEPKYNDRATEDDYHYMNRMLEYMIRMHTDYPVTLEIWKLYGLEAIMQNRERLLVKMFDEDYHNGSDWIPQTWEHKDKFCDYETDLGCYFFTSSSTKTPLKNTPITLFFSLKDSFARNLSEDYTVDIYLNNALIESDYSQKNYVLTSIPSNIDNIIRVECKNTTGPIGEDELIVSVRGCNNADYYVNEDGDDDNRGTRTSQFKTIQKAINTTQNDISVIAVQDGNFDISSYDPINVKNSCSVIGCGSVLLENKDNNHFFSLPQGRGLSLSDLTLQFEGSISDIDNIKITNNNHNRTNVDVLVFDTGEPAVEVTRITMNVDTTVLIGDTITVSGTLEDKYHQGVSGKTVRVTCPGSTPQNVTTDSNGDYSATLEITREGTLTVTAKFGGDSSYAPVRTTTDIVSKIPISDVFTDYDYVVMDMTYVDEDWNYTYKAVGDITSLSDINGAIMNIQEKNKNIRYNRFTSTSTESGITRSELNSLKGVLMGIIYDDYKVKHTDYEVN